MALVSTDAPVVATYIPAPAEWQIILQQAEVLAGSDLVPRSYRGKPANVVVATLEGRRFGWDVTMSMNSLHIIEGTPSMKPEIMLAMIRRAGHSVKGETSSKEATITGIRCDNGDTHTARFTLEDAVNADLCKIKDGRPFARSDRGKKLSWELWTEDMMWARALSKLCRRLFSDVTLGAAYVPEELGAQVDRWGEPIDVQLATPSWVESTSTKEPATVDEATGEALRTRANVLPGPARAEFKTFLNERDITGFPLLMEASKVKVIEPFLANLEKRVAAGEWPVENAAQPTEAPTVGQPAEKPANVDADGVIAEPAQQPESDGDPRLGGHTIPGLSTMTRTQLLALPESVVRAAAETASDGVLAANLQHAELVDQFLHAVEPF